MVRAVPLLFVLATVVAVAVAVAASSAPGSSSAPATLLKRGSADDAGDVVVAETVPVSSPSSRRGLLNEDDDAAAAVRGRASTTTTTTTTTRGWRSTTTVGGRAGGQEASRPQSEEKRQPTLLLREPSSASPSSASPSHSSSSRSSLYSRSSYSPSSMLRRWFPVSPFQSPLYVPGNKARGGDEGNGRGSRAPGQPEISPGSLDPVNVPGTVIPPTYWPAYTVGGYSSTGPLADRLSRDTLNTPFGSDYGFNSAVVVYPTSAATTPTATTTTPTTAATAVAENEDEDEDTDAASTTPPPPRYPVLVWGVGAHNGCTYVDNRQTMEHFASWGFIAICPEVFPEPYLGDEEVLVGAMRYAHDMNFAPASKFYDRVDIDAIGMVGYSLGGGRVIRALSAIESRGQAAANNNQRERERSVSSLSSSSRATAEEEEEETVVSERRRMFTTDDDDEREGEEEEKVENEVEPTAAKTDLVAARSNGRIRRRSSRRRRTLLGGAGDQHRCVDALCESTLCHAAVSLQGWNEGQGSNTSTSLLILTADQDEVAGPWIDNQYPLFERATGRKLMGIVAGGPHNLGPHYWLGFTTAFMLGELVGDTSAEQAAWGILGDPSSVPFGGHPNLKHAWRSVESSQVETLPEVEDPPLDCTLSC